MADEEHELSRRGVWVKHRGNPATTDMFMTLDTPDALPFDQTVTASPATSQQPVTPTPSTSVGHVRWGSWPTRSTP